MGCGASSPSTLQSEDLFNNKPVESANKNNNTNNINMEPVDNIINEDDDNNALPADPRKLTRKFTVNSIDIEKDLAAMENNADQNNYVHEVKSAHGGGEADAPFFHTPEAVKVQVVYATEVGYAPYSRKVNQDSLLIATELNNELGVDLYGVFDGHGEFGHLVSRFVAEKLPLFVETELSNSHAPDASLSKASWKLCEALKRSTIRTTYSGTTATFVLRDKDALHVGNLGDSRAVLATKVVAEDGSEKLQAVDLSRDHKPDLPEEKARVLASGGRVETLKGPPGTDCGPYRVWLAKVDVPGLAMSRSIGDDVAHSVGVSNEVEVTSHKLTKNDQFLILASDGVWEFITSQEAVDLVASSSDDMDLAVRKLVKRAQEQWRKFEQVVDDITAVIITFSASSGDLQLEPLE